MNPEEEVNRLRVALKIVREKLNEGWRPELVVVIIDAALNPVTDAEPVWMKTRREKQLADQAQARRELIASLPEDVKDYAIKCFADLGLYQ